MIVYKYVISYITYHIFFIFRKKTTVMRIRKFEIIECPHCKYEYLPAEIFVPRAYFGHPENIQRDENGKLVSYDGTSVDLFEKYICDNCNTEFRVVSKLQLTTELDFPGNFNFEYVTNLEKYMGKDD